jgi:peptide-methionine (S)-S-oxide reductase
VGYAGGEKEDPTYQSLGQHSETIQIDYDPAKISYEELLDVFWDSHNPTGASISTQYKSIIFFHDEEQKRLAEESRARYSDQIGQEIVTEIRPLDQFYLAEFYHQKYRLQQTSYLKEAFTAIYPEGQDFIDSTAAARVNGYVSGHGSSAELEAELEALGLPPAVGQKLLERVRSMGR